MSETKVVVVERYLRDYLQMYDNASIAECEAREKRLMNSPKMHWFRANNIKISTHSRDNPHEMCRHFAVVAELTESQHIEYILRFC